MAGLYEVRVITDRTSFAYVKLDDAALKRWEEALEHCNKALELDPGNWRTYNNRAAVFVGLKQFDLAMTDVNAGLEIAPDSATLRKSRDVVRQHDNAAKRERWRKPNKA